jgi:hypothetical protein
MKKVEKDIKLILRVLDKVNRDDYSLADIEFALLKLDDLKDYLNSLKEEMKDELREAKEVDEESWFETEFNF